MKNLKNKNVVLTGAASGIGRCLAHELANEGANLFLVDLNMEGLEIVKKELEPSGVNIMLGQCDVAKLTEFESLADQIDSKFGDIDLLINNAGIAGGGAIETLELEDWKKVIDVNLWSIIYSIKTFLPRMLQKGAGYIINTGSGAGVIGLPLHPQYVASKFSVVGISESLYSEFRDRGIKTSVICPSFIKTNIIDRTIIQPPYHLIEGEDIEDKLEGFKEIFWEEYMRDSKTAEKVAKKYLKGIKKEKLYITDTGILRAAMFLKSISRRVYARVLRGQGVKKREVIERTLSRLGLKFNYKKVKPKKDRKKLKGKNCLLTGAAAGIGRSLAFELAKEGVNLYLSDLNMEGLEKIKQELEKYNVEVFIGKCDVSNFEDFSNLAQDFNSKFSDLDILINNAGISGGGFTETLSIDEWKRVIDVNLWSIIYSIKTFLPKMLERGEGYFVNVGSAAGIVGLPYHIQYVASKFGVVGISEALYSEVNERGVDVSVICPMHVKTDLIERSNLVIPPKLLELEENMDERLEEFKEIFWDKYNEGGFTADEAAKKYIKGIKKRKLYIYDSRTLRLAMFLKSVSDRLYKRVLRGLRKEYIDVIEDTLREMGVDFGDSLY